MGSATSVVGQASDEQLAAHYYQEGDFEKAQLYYERLYNTSGSANHYDYFLTCLIELENYKEAEKLIKKQMRREPINMVYYVDMGQLYKVSGEEGKAKQQYEKGVKELTANQKQITDLATAFLEAELNSYAVECYEKGLKLLNNDFYFRLQIATVKGADGDYEGMIVTYLDLVGENERYLQTVQNNLNRTLNFLEDTERADLLKTQLLKRIQKEPNRSIYADMLIWLFIQRKDFNAAYVQSKAIDRRENGQGERVMQIGDFCHSNREYDIAIKCYEHVVDLGRSSFNYHPAKIALLEVMNEKITNSNYTRNELVELESRYTETLGELGKTAGTSELLRNLAHLKAFYLDKTDEGVLLLREGLKIPGMSKMETARIKLELGDVLLLNGNIWDASIYYMQVDKAFKHDVIGHEAKFRNSRISFYSGDFEWAQTQLNVLKASTSKLIANDAMNLSLLITDNLNLDTTYRSMNLYAQADLLVFQNKYDEALEYMDSITREFPGHSLSDEILYQKYTIERKRQQWEKAADFLQQIITFHGDDILADDATYELAQLYDYILKDKEKAMENYEKLLMDYPGSLFAVDARKRYRTLRGDSFNDGTIKEIE